MKNSDRVALITGSTSGIGKAIALQLSDDGFNVVFHSKESIEEGERLACSVPRSTYIQANLADQVISDHACKKVEDDFFDKDRESRKSSLHLYDEKTLKSKVLSRLATNFHIEEEVWGTHPSGNKVRIDAVITPKLKTRQWGKNAVVSFGIEFKSSLTKSKGSRRGKNSYFAQCYDYSFAEFKGYGQIPILICPKFRIGYEMASFLAQSNIGFLDYDNKEQQLEIEFHQTVWCENTGPTQFGQSKIFTKRTGVRSPKVSRNAPSKTLNNDSDYREDEPLI